MDQNSNSYRLLNSNLFHKKKNHKNRQAGLVPARPGCRPGRDPSGLAFGRPRLRCRPGQWPRLPAQAGRAGRAPARGLRPQDGPSTARPGARARQHAVAAGGDLRRERDRGRGKLAEKERSSPPVKLWVLDDGGADEGRQNRGRRTTAAAEVVEDAGDAPDDPGSIPLVRRELTAWRGGRRPRLAPGRLQSATIRQ